MTILNWVDSFLLEKALDIKTDCYETIYMDNKNVLFYDGIVYNNLRPKENLNFILSEVSYIKSPRKREFHFGIFKGPSLRDQDILDVDRNNFYCNAGIISTEKRFRVPGRELQNNVLGVLATLESQRGWMEEYFESQWYNSRFVLLNL
jgi:hypothetical protein